MRTTVIIRFAFLLSLWLLLCYLLISQRALTLWTLFVIIASGIIIFVPLYKKYVKGNDGKK